jgi:acyl carrier protein
MSWLKQIFASAKPEPAAGPAPAPVATDSGAATPGTTLAELKRFLSAQMSGPAKVEASDIPDDAHVLDGGYVDSVTAVDFLVFIQKRFGVRLSETDLTGGLGQLSKLAARLAGGSNP